MIHEMECKDYDTVLRRNRSIAYRRRLEAMKQQGTFRKKQEELNKSELKEPELEESEENPDDKYKKQRQSKVDEYQVILEYVEPAKSLPPDLQVGIDRVTESIPILNEMELYVPWNKLSTRVDDYLTPRTRQSLLLGARKAMS